MTTNASASQPPPARRWTNAYLDPFRRQTDPEADAIARGVFERGGPGGLTRLTRHLEDWEAPLPDDAPDDLRELFERPLQYPSWIDPDKITHAEDLFVLYGPVTASFILLHGFPMFLTNVAGARAFYMARIFSPDSLRVRMLELAQFVLFMTERGGLGQTWLSPAQAAVKGIPAHGVRKGRGLVAFQRLRIIHANVRILLKLADGKQGVSWDLATLGEPINQEDLALAVVCFAICTMEGLKKVGIEQTQEDKEAMLVAWKAAGILLGLSDELQPADLADAIALRAAIVARQSRKTEEGTVVAREVLHIVKGLLPPGLRRVPDALMRFQLGDEVADMLEVPKRPLLLGAITMTSPIWKQKQVFARLAMAISPPLLHWAKTKTRLGDAGRLQLPEKLATRLGSEH
jgi:hypothetical protein